MKDTQQSAKSTSATDKASTPLTEEERAALRDRHQEAKAAARRGSRAGKADGERDVLAKIAEMPQLDRDMAERLHAIVKASAPALSPKTWYGMPWAAAALLEGHYLRDLGDGAIQAFLSCDGGDGDPVLLPSGSLQSYRGAIAAVGDHQTAFGHRDALVEFVAVAAWTDPAQDQQ